jgi:hypothetical protein
MEEPNINDSDVELIQTHLLALSKLPAEQLAKQMTKATPEVVKYLRAVKVKPKTKKKKKEEKEKEKKKVETKKRLKWTASKSEVTNQDEVNNFYIWYNENLKKPAQKYKDRVISNDSKLNFSELSAIPPWDVEQQCLKQFSIITGQNFDSEQTKKILLSHKNEFKKLSANIQDRKISVLAGEMEMAAKLEAFYQHFVVNTKLMTWEELAKNLEISANRGSTLRMIYTKIIKKYNLILYTGCTISDLIKWRKPLFAYFNQYPDEALFFTGDSQNLMMNEMTWSFSTQNHAKRQKVEKHASEKEMEKASAKMEKLQ